MFASAVSSLAQPEANVHSPNTLIIYIATYRVYDQSIRQPELELCTSGGTPNLLTGNQFTAYFSGGLWSNVSKLLIIDACQSGGLLATSAHYSNCFRAI
jgi:hypothetical protein